jgi:hypothetical protein
MVSEWAEQGRTDKPRSLARRPLDPDHRGDEIGCQTEAICTARRRRPWCPKVA